MDYSTHSNIILLSNSHTVDKKSTYGFEMVEVYSLQELMQLMNSKAVSSGLYLNGHRHTDFLKAVGNVYFIDIDLVPADNEAPYYQTIETKLKELNVSFVSVPSQSANEYPYKRHIAVILDSYLPIGVKAFKDASNYIVNYINIDVDKIDMKVAVDNVRQLAPACINNNFTNYNDVSNFYQGVALSLPNEFKAKETILNDYDVDTNTMITFADNKTAVTIYEAKKIIVAGDRRTCFCPKHNDTNPSATIFHNSDGSIKINCFVCGSIKISTNFIPTVPTVGECNKFCVNT